MPKAERNIAKSDSKPAKKQKKTRAKAKNVTQTVIVNVGKRGGSKSAPPVRSAPTPLQQALQLLQTQRQPPQGESLIQSTQILQRMIEPINRRLEVLIRQPSQVPAINFPPINIAQPAISVTQPPINIAQPAINISSMQPMVKPQASMASQTERESERVPTLWEAPQIQTPLVQAQPPLVQGIKPFQPYQLPQTPLSYRDYVLDLPDAPLVQPPKPLVSGGSLRLDPEHEDVPIVEAERESERVPTLWEAKEEEKAKEEQAMEVSSEEEYEVPLQLRDDYSRVPLTVEALGELNIHKSTAAKPLTLRGIYIFYGLQLSRDLIKGGKPAIIQNLISKKGSK